MTLLSNLKKHITLYFLEIKKIEKNEISLVSEWLQQQLL